MEQPRLPHRHEVAVLPNDVVEKVRKYSEIGLRFIIFCGLIEACTARRRVWGVDLSASSFFLGAGLRF